MASSMDMLTDLAVEVKIPINECFISLGVPAEFFMEDSARAQALAEARTTLQSLEQNANAMEESLAGIGQPRLQPEDSGYFAAAQQRAAEVFLFQEPAFGMVVTAAALASGIDTGRAQAEALATPLRPKLFLVETYHLTTQPTASGKGPLVGSVPFGPGQKQTVETIGTHTETMAVTQTTTAMESEDSAVTQDFNTHVAESNAQSGGTDSHDYRMKANFHGDASVGFGSGEVNAQLGVQGGSNNVRRDFSNAVEGAMDKQMAQTSASREQRVHTQQSDTQTTDSTKTTKTSEVTNPNPTHAVTFLWFQSVQQQTSFLALTNVEVAVRNTDPTQDRQVPLHDLDRLLTALLDPTKVLAVRQAIKGELEIILDYQDEVRNIVEEVPFGPNNTMLRLKQNLQTVFVLKDANGNPVRNINVAGVLLKVATRIIPTDVLVEDLVVGSASAV